PAPTSENKTPVEATVTSTTTVSATPVATQATPVEAQPQSKIDPVPDATLSQISSAAPVAATPEKSAEPTDSSQPAPPAAPAPSGAPAAHPPTPPQPETPVLTVPPAAAALPDVENPYILSGEIDRARLVAQSKLFRHYIENNARRL